MDLTPMASEDAYEGAPYNLATAHTLVGRALVGRGAAEQALSAYGESKKRFEKLVNQGASSATQMVALTNSRMADCLVDLGHFDLRLRVDLSPRIAVGVPPTKRPDHAHVVGTFQHHGQRGGR